MLFDGIAPQTIKTAPFLTAFNNLILFGTINKTSQYWISFGMVNKIEG